MSPELPRAQVRRPRCFKLDRITFANIHGNPDAVAEVIRVLTPLREACKIALPQAAQEQAAAARGR